LQQTTKIVPRHIGGVVARGDALKRGVIRQPDGWRLAEFAGFSALSYQLATKLKCMQPSSNLQPTRQFWQTAVLASG